MWSKNSLLLLEPLLFDCQSTIFITLIKDQDYIICLNVNIITQFTVLSVLNLSLLSANQANAGHKAA
jgi:hypothetical protein